MSDEISKASGNDVAESKTAYTSISSSAAEADGRTIVSASQFRGSNYCRAKKEFEDLKLSDNKTGTYDRAIAVKSTIHGMLHGKLAKTKEEALDMIDQVTESVSETSETDRLKAEALAKDILRYVKCEHRTPLPEGSIHSSYIPCEEYLIRVKPDEIFDDGTSLEGVIYKAGKPSINQSGKKRDTSVQGCAELHFLAIALRNYVPAGQSRKIKASYYFLRKNTDSASAGNYDSNYFSDKGGNIVTLEESYNANVGPVRTDVDRAIEGFVDDFGNGIECSGTDCDHCILNPACTFTAPPEKQELKEVKDKPPVTPTEAQQKIIDTLDGVIRVVAGAGAGKTETLVAKVLNIVKHLMADGMNVNEALRHILMITFTNAGADEMKHRLMLRLKQAGIMGASADDMQIMTFNTFAFNIVKKYFERVGFTKSPLVVDHTSNRRIITDLLDGNVVPGLDYQNFTMKGRGSMGALNCTEKTFEAAKYFEILPDDPDAETKLHDALQEKELLGNGLVSDISIPALLDLFRDYSERLLGENFVTFSDQEPMMFRLLNETPEILDEYGYWYVLVDEFQDSNAVQMETVRRLRHAKGNRGIMVVGDDSQSIFKFRGTSPENIQQFEAKMGESVIDLFLTDNYRSKAPIIALANAINARCPHRIEKDLVAKRGDGHKVVVQGFVDDKEEYAYIVTEIQKLMAPAEDGTEGYTPEDICVIARTKKELRKIAQVLSEAHLPWVFMNPMLLQENSRVKAAMALAQAIRTPDATASIFGYLTGRYGKDILKMDHAVLDSEIGKMRGAIEHVFYGMGDDAVPFEEQRQKFHQWLEEIDMDDEIYRSFLDRLYACEDIFTEFDWIKDFEIFGDDEEQKMDQRYKGIVLTTAHSSKGLEWPVVFNTISEYDTQKCHGRNRDDEVEETRRLLFVSVTRARDILYVTGQYVAYGKKDDRTYNQFLHDVYEDLNESDRYSAELFNIAAAEARKEQEAKDRRNARAREQRAKKKAEGVLSNYKCSGQMSFI